MSVLVSQKVMKSHGEAQNNRAFGAEESVVVQEKIKKSGLEVQHVYDLRHCTVYHLMHCTGLCAKTS
jgi:hypothetical protein